MGERTIRERSDAEVVAVALGGSQDGYQELVRRFERPVFSLVVRMVRDRPTAEDLTQEAFVKAFRNLETYDPERKFSSWLFKIAHNTTLDHLRKRELETVSLEAGGEDDGSGGLAAVLSEPGARGTDLGVGRSELAEALEEAVGALKEDYREVVLLRYGEGLAYQEIADVTGLPMGTVKTNIHRARKALMDHLSAGGWGPEGIRA